MDLSKKQRQEQGVLTWLNNGAKGTLNHVMRFGKTEEGCMVIERLLLRYPESTVVITTPSEAATANWNSYLISYFKNKPYITNQEDYIRLIGSKVRVVPIGQLSYVLQGGELTCTLLIVDEIHKFTTDIRFNILRNIKYTYILGLTGTYPSGEAKAKLDIIAPVVDVITEKEALQNKWVSMFLEFNILLELKGEARERYIKHSIPIRETMELFKGTKLLFPDGRGGFIFRDDFDVINSCWSGKKYLNELGKVEYFDAANVRALVARFKGWSRDMDLNNDLARQINTYWSPNAIYERVKRHNEIIRKRNEILINHPDKLDAVLEIYRLNPVSTICFNESTDFADIIAHRINREFGSSKPVAIAYHSNISSRGLIDPATRDFIRYKTGTRAGEIKMFGKDTLKKIALDGLRNNQYTFLSTARALDESIDIPNLEQVITTAGTANPIQYKQRTARGKTVDIYNPNKITKIFNICFDDFENNDGEIIKSRDLSKLTYRQFTNYMTPIAIHGIDNIKDCF